jgi:hypothetical protein
MAFQQGEPHLQIKLGGTLSEVLLHAKPTHHFHRRYTGHIHATSQRHLGYYHLAKIAGCPLLGLHKNLPPPNSQQALESYLPMQ